MDGTAQAHESHDIYDLTYGYVVGEGIDVIHGHSGALLPPLLETQVEDRDAEREVDDDADAGVDDESHLAILGNHTVIQDQKHVCGDAGERGRK